uniref:Uncharacterized protein n=1 Tax=Arion vulgaris TaxID=1028688 RepID=A0A0B7API0_9EUPU
MLSISINTDPVKQYWKQKLHRLLCKLQKTEFYERDNTEYMKNTSSEQKEGSPPIDRAWCWTRPNPHQELFTHHLKSKEKVTV